MVTKTHVELFQRMESTLSFLEEKYKGRFNFNEERNSLTIIRSLLDVILEHGGVKMSNDNQRKYWTDEEVKNLIVYSIRGLSLNKQSELLKRTNKAISSKRLKLGIKTHKWTNEDIKFLIYGVADNISIKELEKSLKKPSSVIESKIKNLGLNNKELAGLV